MDGFIEAAIEEAKKSSAQGGIPIGSVLVKDGKIIGTFEGSEDFMKQHGVEIINLDNNECITLMRDFIEKNHDLWFEDIGK